MDDQDRSGFPRQLARGRAFVYVIPRRDDTVFKIGFARDPIERWRSLHRRFFRFFDLDLGVLVEARRVVEARTLERELLKRFGAYAALQPLEVVAQRGGAGEWRRGVLDEAVAAAVELAGAAGMPVHRPAARWLRMHLAERRDLLYAWSSRMVEQAEAEIAYLSGAGASPAARAIDDMLDAYAAVGIDVVPDLPARVTTWLARRDGTHEA